MIEFILVGALLALASGLVVAGRRRDGHFRPAPGAHLSAADLGHALGGRATFVQFSSAVCSACPQVRGILGEVAADQPGVKHVEVSAEDRPDLVRRLGIMRTPTVLLLDPDGVITSRTSGAIRPEQALAVLGARP